MALFITIATLSFVLVLGTASVRHIPAVARERDRQAHSRHR